LSVFMFIVSRRCVIIADELHVLVLGFCWYVLCVVLWGLPKNQGYLCRLYVFFARKNQLPGAPDVVTKGESEKSTVQVL
jgi:hypothetical protein